MEPAVTKRERQSYSIHAALFGAARSIGTTRCCVIAAHPNDEIVGSGYLIYKLPDVHIVHVSSGAPPSRKDVLSAGFKSISDYREIRRNECLAALQLAHVPVDRIHDLGLAQFKASYKLVELSLKIRSLLQQQSPQIILTHAYEGGHPDHDATAFVVHAATRLLSESGFKPPAIFEMALYPGKSGMSKVPEFLHNPSRESTTLVMDRKALELKSRMFECFKSHQQIFESSPLGPERFREASGYDFTKPPHSGELYYENFDWGMSGEEWRKLAAAALQKLFPQGTH